MSQESSIVRLLSSIQEELRKLKKEIKALHDHNQSLSDRLSEVEQDREPNKARKSSMTAVTARG